MVQFNKLCLASQSPRRRELLEQLGVNFEVLPAHIDETRFRSELTHDYVARITLAKAHEVWHLPNYHKKYPVLASDTAVCIDGAVLGKPENVNDAVYILRQLSGRTHEVLTGVALVFGKRHEYRLSVSQVTFDELSSEQIERYVATGEGLDKAGSYAVQGFAAAFIRHISGSYSGIMGLPIFETTELLKRWGVSFWNSPDAS